MWTHIHTHTLSVSFVFFSLVYINGIKRSHCLAPEKTAGVVRGKAGSFCQKQGADSQILFFCNIDPGQSFYGLMAW